MSHALDLTHPPLTGWSMRMVPGRHLSEAPSLSDGGTGSSGAGDRLEVNDLWLVRISLNQNGWCRCYWFPCAAVDGRLCATARAKQVGNGGEVTLPPDLAGRANVVSTPPRKEVRVSHPTMTQRSSK